MSASCSGARSVRLLPVPPCPPLLLRLFPLLSVPRQLRLSTPEERPLLCWILLHPARAPTPQEPAQGVCGLTSGELTDGILVDLGSPALPLPGCTLGHLCKPLSFRCSLCTMGGFPTSRTGARVKQRDACTTPMTLLIFHSCYSLISHGERSNPTSEHHS